MTTLPISASWATACGVDRRWNDNINAQQWQWMTQHPSHIYEQLLIGQFTGAAYLQQQQGRGGRGGDNNNDDDNDANTNTNTNSTSNSNNSLSTANIGQDNNKDEGRGRQWCPQHQTPLLWATAHREEGWCIWGRNENGEGGSPAPDTCHCKHLLAGGIGC